MIVAGLAWRIGWAVANTAYTMIACHSAGHPGQHWRDGVRRCKCGWRFPA